jgi:hypothetical protein
MLGTNFTCVVKCHDNFFALQLLKLEHRGFDQAMKIAADFCHLPLSLAKRGYEVGLFWFLT